MELTKIEEFFNQYLQAFKHYNLADLLACYHLPCTLNTPDKVIVINDINSSEQAFNDIFAQLAYAKTHDIKALKASFSVITDKLYLACVDWSFIDEKDQVFTDFCVIYHVVKIGNELKIINTNSHELDNSITLSTPFSINS